MTMGTWVIISWVFVALLTAGNIFFFFKLKKASEQMMKMAFPGAKDMNSAMSQMQAMMSQVQRRGGGGPARGRGSAQRNAQMQQAMQMLRQMQKGKR